MLPTRHEINMILREHPLIMLRERVKRAFVVGSLATGTQRPDSDIDILLQVTPKRGYTAAELAEKYRQKLRQYFVTHDIKGKADWVHPQWDGRRVDVWITYDEPDGTLPLVEL